MATNDLPFGIYTELLENNRTLIKGISSKSNKFVEEVNGIFSDNHNGWIINSSRLDDFIELVKGGLYFPTDSIRHSQRSRRTSSFHRARSRSPSRLTTQVLKKSGRRKKINHENDDEEDDNESCVSSIISNDDTENKDNEENACVNPSLLLGDSSSDSEYEGSSSDSDFPDPQSPRNHEKEVKEILKRRKRYLDRRKK